MIEIVTIALAAIVVALWVIQPLRRGPRPQAPEPELRRAGAEAATRSALSGIVDIEEERALGKLGEADFEALKRQYEAQAIAALHDLDAVKQPDGDDDVETEIAAMRARLTCPACGGIRSARGMCERCGAH